MRASKDSGTLRNAVNAAITVTSPAIKVRSAASQYLGQFADRYPWVRHWEFWLAVAIAAFLRLWHLEDSQFVFGPDQTLLMTLPRDSVLRGALPATGFPTSFGSFLYHPLDIYLMLPFTAISPNPEPIVIAIALLNIITIALLYPFVLHFFGRRPAAIATLLMATAGQAVVFSRFLWQLNFLIPLFMLWTISLFIGISRGSRGWLAWNIILLALIICLHSSAIFLVLITLAAIVLSPLRPRVGELLIAVAAVALLLLPRLLWTMTSPETDVQQLRLLLSAPSSLNANVIRTVMRLLGPPTYNGVGPFTPYARVTSDSPFASLGRLNDVITAMGLALYGLSLTILTWGIVAPLYSLWQDQARTPILARMRAWVGACWRLLRRDAALRLRVVLWLWVVLPPLALLRHSVTLYAHYVLFLFPAVFLVAGLGIDQVLRFIAERLPGVLARRGIGAGRRLTLTARGAQIAVVALLCIVVAGQALQDTLYIASIASGRIEADAGYGYPLGAVQAADERISALQRQVGAAAVYISVPYYYYHFALAYLLVADHPGRRSFYGDCLMLPPAGARPILVVSTRAESPAAQLLPTLPGTQHIAEIPMLGGQPFEIYRVDGAPSTLPGESNLPPIDVQDAAGNGLRLQSGTLVSPGVLRLRWSVLQSTPNGQPPQLLRMQPRVSPDAPPAGLVLPATRCEPTSWQAGDQLYTWTSLIPVDPQTADPTLFGPHPVRQGSPPPDDSVVALGVQAQTSDWRSAMLGPLHLISGDTVVTPGTQFAPHLASGSPPAGISVLPTGEVQLALRMFSRP